MSPSISNRESLKLDFLACGFWHAASIEHRLDCERRHQVELVLVQAHSAMIRGTTPPRSTRAPLIDASMLVPLAFAVMTGFAQAVSG